MTTIHFGVADADSLALGIYDSVSKALISDDIDAVSAALAGLDRLKREISEMLETTRDKMVSLMGDSPECEHNGFHFERKPGTSRKAWNHDSLSTVIAKRLSSMCIDLDTGEIVKTPEELIKDAFNFAGVSYWRVKELQKIGINADAYCEVVESKPSIIIRSTGKE